MTPLMDISQVMRFFNGIENFNGFAELNLFLRNREQDKFMVNFTIVDI